MKTILFLFITIGGCYALFGQDTIDVNNVDQFIQGVKSNRVMRIFPGDYPLEEATIFKEFIQEQKQTEYLVNEFVVYSAGKGVVVKGVKNLTLVGVGSRNGDHVLTTGVGKGYVLTFDQCINIKLENLSAKHMMPSNENKGVWMFSQCTGVGVSNVKIAGNAERGIDAWRSKNVQVTDVEISECVNGIASLKDTWSIRIDNCNFHHNTACKAFWDMSGCRDVKITNSTFSENQRSGWRVCEKSTLFNVQRCDMLNFKGNTIRGNSCFSLGSADVNRLLESGNVIKKNKLGK